MDLSLWFRIAASSITLSDFYDDLVIILDHRVICIYDYSGWANVMVFSRYQVFERTIYGKIRTVWELRVEHNGNS